MISIINIGLLYDYKSDYIIHNEDYYDFSSKIEVDYVKKTLKEAGYNVIDIGNQENFKEYILKQKNDVDIVFNMIEGYKSRNREGLIPAICEFFNIKYVGTDSFGMSLTLHKTQTKVFLNSLGIKTAKHFLFINTIHNISNLNNYLEENNISFPIIVKPNHEGSSMGVTLVYDIKQAKQTIENLLKKYNQDILCEEYIYGREMSVPLYQERIDVKVLGIAEFTDTSNEHIGIFTTKKKTHGFHLQKQPGISFELQNKIEQQSRIVFNALKLKNYSRIDWIIKDNEPYFIEATPLPCFEPDNCFEWSLKEKNICFAQFFKTIIEPYFEKELENATQKQLE